MTNTSQPLPLFNHEYTNHYFYLHTDTNYYKTWIIDFVLQDSVPELYPLRYKDLPIPLFGICDTFSKLILEAYKIRTSSAIIWNTMDCLEPSSLSHIQHQFQVPILPLGPMHKFAPASSSSLWKEDTSCME